MNHNHEAWKQREAERSAREQLLREHDLFWRCLQQIAYGDLSAQAAKAKARFAVSKGRS